MRTEVFSEDGVVGFADFTSLVMYGGMVNMSTFGEEDREETYDEFEVLGERKTNNSEHSFKGVIRVINPIKHTMQTQGRHHQPPRRKRGDIDV